MEARDDTKSKVILLRFDDFWSLERSNTGGDDEDLTESNDGEAKQQNLHNTTLITEA